MTRNECPTCGSTENLEMEDLYGQLAAAHTLAEDLQAQLAAATQRAERAEAESEGRRRVLVEKADEAKREWARAERAEADLAALRAAVAVTPEVVERLARVILGSDKIHSDAGHIRWDMLADDYQELLRTVATEVLRAIQRASEMGERR